MQVLIVEEELSVANAMAYALEARGHAVTVASSAQVALGLPQPDVLIADPELPGISGLDLLEQYHHADIAPRTVFISATPSLESCRRALRLGASDFLSKPFRLDELVRAVELENAEPSVVLEETYDVATNPLETCLRDLAAFGIRRGLGPTCRARACSAVGEIVDNVIKHAYPFGEGELRMTATVDQRALVVTLIDNGIGLDTNQVATEIMSVSGGLSRASSLSESLDLRGEPGVGTTVQLSFGSYLVDFAGDDHADLTELDYLTPDTARQILSTLELEGSESFFQLTPSLAVVIGRLLSGPDPQRIAAQALRS